MSRHLPAAMLQNPYDEDWAEQPQAPQTSQIIDQVWHSKRLDELENALNVLVSPQRFVNASAGDHATGMLAYRGQADLGIFHSRVGRDIDLFLEPEEADDRMAFVMTASGTGEFLLNRKVFFSFSRPGNHHDIWPGTIVKVRGGNRDKGFSNQPSEDHGMLRQAAGP